MRQHGTRRHLLSRVGGDDKDLVQGLDAHWTFDEDEKSKIFHDASTHKRVARSNHVLMRTSRCIGNRALSFRGRLHNDYLVVDRSQGTMGYDLGTSFTFACWIRLSDSPRGDLWQSIMDNGVSGVRQPSFGMRVLGGRLAVDFWSAKMTGTVAHNYPYGEGGGSNEPTATPRREVAIEFGKWSHVVFTLDRSAIE